MKKAETAPVLATEPQKPLQVGSRALKLALKHSPNGVRQRAENIGLRRILRGAGFDTRLLNDASDINAALALEQTIWHEVGYGGLESYRKYIPQSTVIGAYDGDEVVGVVRLFDGSPILPPFITDMYIESERTREELIAGCLNGTAEEFGTVAVKPEYRGGRAHLDLFRTAYRDATSRQIQHWGVVMEPERVNSMNRHLGFTFNQIGPAFDYQGGMCAPHVMSLAEVRQNMSRTKPELYDWFVNQPL